MPKVMLVEDDPTMLSLLETLLQIEGFETTRAGEENLDEIINRIKAEQPDAALLDVHLRRGNGMDLLRKIRQIPDLARLKVLMCSGMNVNEECLAAGANGFLQKPYIPDDLINMIHRALEDPHPVQKL